MQEGIKIREMNISDIPQVIKIGIATPEFQVDSKFKGFWSKKQLENWCKSKKDVLLVAKKGKEVIGFVFFAHHIPTGKVTFENGWVKKEFRGEGLIEELTKNGIGLLKGKGAIYICGLAKKDNIPSIKFLERTKFIKGFDFTWLHRKI